MAEAGELLQLVEKEVEAVGVSLGDGFDLIDLLPVAEAVVRVTRAMVDTWKDATREDKVRLSVDLLDEIDMKHDIFAKASKAIVAWDIPYAPDAIIDTVLSEERLTDLLDMGATALIERVVDRLLSREAKFGSRCFDLISAQ